MGCGLIGLVGPDEGDEVANSAFPDTMREGDGSGLTLVEGIDPCFATMTWLIWGAAISGSGVSIMGAVEGVWESSSVGKVASLR
jgi:hypothetical protein